jgi:hypothetical protein
VAISFLPKEAKPFRRKCPKFKEKNLFPVFRGARGI